MATPTREYYPLPLAASIIGCTADDLIHLAANRYAKLGVLFCVDGFLFDRYLWHDNTGIFDDNHLVQMHEFSGFVHIDACYFMDMERNGGDLEFNIVRLLDGSSIRMIPSEDYCGSEYRSVDKIFIHFDDLLPFFPKPEDPPKSDSGTLDRAHVSNSLAILNQAAAKFWANADKDDRSTHPKKSDVVAWLIEHGFSQIKAESGATIIRPEWAPTGRIAQQ